MRASRLLVVVIAAAMVALLPTAAFAMRFQRPQEVSESGSPSSVVTADLNADGLSDIVTAAGGDSLTFHMNRTPAGAATATLPTSPLTLDGVVGVSSVAAGDLDGDGKPDLAVVASGNDTLTIAVNDSAVGLEMPSFPETMTIPTADDLQSVVIADFNADGKNDVAVAGQVFALQVFVNTTPSGASPPTFAAPVEFSAGAGGPNAMVAADLSGDGKPDLATVFGGNVVTVLTNVSTTGGAADFTVDQIGTGTGSPDSIAAGDLSRDGLADLAISKGNEHTIRVLRNTTTSGGAVTFASSSLNLDSGQVARGLAIGDMTQDGVPDIVDTSGNSAWVIFNSSPAAATSVSFSSQLSFSNDDFPSALALADFNRDGARDIVMGNTGSDTSSVLLASPSVEYTPSRLTFGTVPLGTISPPQQVTVTNSGFAPLRGAPQLVGISGTPVGSYIVTANTCRTGTIGAGDSCTFSVRFVPNGVEATARTERLRISANITWGGQWLTLIGSTTGTPHDDSYTGTAVADRLSGEGGDDQLRGLGGADTMFGGPGNDRLGGGAGHDRLDGGPGNDLVDARDGAPGDTVICGSGTDIAIVNPGDTASGCEAVLRT